MKLTKSTISSLKISALAVTALGIAFSSGAQAATDTWTGTGAQSWSNTAEWSGGSVAGTTGTTTNTDTANITSGAAQTITIDSTRNLQNITIIGSGAGAETFSGGPLVLTGGGAITQTAGSGAALTFSSDIYLEGIYPFSVNNALTSANNFVASSTVMGAGASPINLTLFTNQGSFVSYDYAFAPADVSVISGVISNGVGGTVLSLTKAGAGHGRSARPIRSPARPALTEVFLMPLLSPTVEWPAAPGQSSNAASNLIFNGGTVQYSAGPAASTDRLFTIGDGSGTANSATIQNSAGEATSPFNTSVNTVTFTNTGAIAFGGTAGAHTLTLTGGNQANNTFDLQISDDSRGGGAATSLIKAGVGTWVLNGPNANTYTGTTSILGGVLRDATAAGNGVSATSNLLLQGSVTSLPASPGEVAVKTTGNTDELIDSLLVPAVFESATNVTRALGTGAGQVQLTGGVAGFSANNASSGATPVTFNLGGAGATLQFENSSGTLSPGVLVLNASTANTGLILTNGLDLNGVNQSIETLANTATINGVISSSVGTAGLNKTGTGTLVLNGSNTYNGGTSVGAGVLTIGANGSLGSGGAVIFGGGVLNLNGASNISSSLAAGHTVVVNANGALGLGATGFTQSNLASLIDPSSGGVLGIDTAGFNNALTMTNIGNGAMSLGSTIGTSNTTGGVYTATSLTVPAGGTENHVNGGLGHFRHHLPPRRWRRLADHHQQCHRRPTWRRLQPRRQPDQLVDADSGSWWWRRR